MTEIDLHASFLARISDRLGDLGPKYVQRLFDFYERNAPFNELMMQIAREEGRRLNQANGSDVTPPDHALKWGFCYTAAEITARIMQRRGFKAHPLLVTAFYFNAGAVSYLEKHPAASFREMVAAEPTAWGVGIDDKGDSYHAVTIIEDRVLYDPTAAQFSRPLKGIPIDPPVVGRWDGERSILDMSTEDLKIAGLYIRRKSQVVNLDLNLSIRVIGDKKIRRFVEEWT